MVTQSHKYELESTTEELGGEQADDPDISPIARRSPGKPRSCADSESGSLWCGECSTEELEGHRWHYQLVVPEGRWKDLVRCTHGWGTGTHLGSSRTLALLEHGFYWPGMQACLECDCAPLKMRATASVHSRGPD